MKKIPVVYKMDYATEILTPEVKAGCEWVVNGEGIATIKFDGSACRFYEGRLWKRFDRKLNKRAQWQLDNGKLPAEIDLSFFRNPPEGFEPCEVSYDPVSFHWPGWVPVTENNPDDKYHNEALRNHCGPLVEGNTYELVGPTLASNPYNLTAHLLVEHGTEIVVVEDRTLEGLWAYLNENYIEGLVFHHPDGRMAKIRRKDYKLFWVKEDTRKHKRVACITQTLGS